LLTQHLPFGASYAPRDVLRFALWAQSGLKPRPTLLVLVPGFPDVTHIFVAKKFPPFASTVSVREFKAELSDAKDGAPTFTERAAGADSSASRKLRGRFQQPGEFVLGMACGCLGRDDRPARFCWWAALWGCKSAKKDDCVSEMCAASRWHAEGRRHGGRWPRLCELHCTVYLQCISSRRAIPSLSIALWRAACISPFAKGGIGSAGFTAENGASVWDGPPAPASSPDLPATPGSSPPSQGFPQESASVSFLAANL
jgi:hypothetical protein